MLSAWPALSGLLAALSIQNVSSHSCRTQIGTQIRKVPAFDLDDDDDVSEDVNALLQRGAPQVSAASALESNASRQSLVASEGQAMADIMSGATTKSEVEIVLAHYAEDISWSDAYENIRTVYCKGPKARRPSGCTPLKNVGREGHTYLYHIVHNYDRLSEWTVFTQAQAPTHGYRGQSRGGGHMLPGVSFDAYVLPDGAGGMPRTDGAVFVMTGALHMPTLNHSLRLSFVDARKSLTLHQQPACPKTELLDGWERWWNLGKYKKYIGQRCNIQEENVPKAVAEYWDEFIKLPRPAHDVVFFTQGARFAASRERIQQRPKEFYEALLEKLSHKKDPCQNYFNEWLWYYIIGAPAESPCDPALVIKEAGRDKSWKGVATLVEEMQAESRLRAEFEHEHEHHRPKSA